VPRAQVGLGRADIESGRLSAWPDQGIIDAEIEADNPMVLVTLGDETKDQDRFSESWHHCRADRHHGWDPRRDDDPGDSQSMSVDPVYFGAFRLDAQIGQGGMAQVWAATHVSGASTAIKVMTAERAQDPVWRAGFLREIRAIAGLNHPNIVRLYDCGEVPEAGAALGFAPRSPWVAMERASGDLHAAWPTHWGALRRVLFDILDALAHAHARGVIHRDLKPANVLVTQDDRGSALRLTDFGIAHVGNDESSLIASPTTTSGGTPEYMAPEQVTGRVAEQGPWTDLYALGCMAYALASGRAPYDGASALSIAMQHVTGVAPPLEPRFAVPNTFHLWLAQLMSRDPRNRYRRAADAAFALARLSEGFAHAAPVDTPTFALSDTVAALHTMVLDVGDLDLAFEGGTGEQAPRPPVPETWRTGEASLPQLIDAGLGLLGVRRPPLAGRVAHRDLLWARLHAADAGAPAQVVMLIGDRGLGTSMLARWFCERASEVGAAEIFEARHQRTDTTDDGIGAMLRRYFGALSLTPDDARTHIEHQAGGDGAEGIAEAALWSPDGNSERFESADVRHAIVRRFLAARAQHRPVILFIDEAQWGGDTLAFARSILREGVPGVLMVMAVDESGMPFSGPESRAHWGRLQTKPRVEHLRVEPLSQPVHCRLISSLLPLDPALRMAVHDHTLGHPKFAHDLLLYWVEEGWLTSGAAGFELRADVAAWVPDIATLHIRRFERIEQGDEIAQQAIEAAALLGARVRSSTWVAVCRALGVRLPIGLVDRLFRSGLAQPREGGWAFDCDSAVDALRDRARAAGRYKHVNLVCARVLGEEGEQALRYLLRAEAYAELIPKMLRAVRGLMARSEHGSALTLLRLLDTPFAALQVDSPDPRWIEARILEARASRYALGVEAAQAVLATIENLVDVAPPPIAAQLAHLRATVAGPAVDIETRHARYTDALARYTALGEHVGASECLHGLGLMALLTGRLPTALTHMTEAVRTATLGDDDSVRAWAHQGVGLVKRFLEDPSGEQDAQTALDLFRARGARGGMGATHFSVGDFRLAAGDFDAAAVSLDRSLSIFTAIDSDMKILPQVARVAVSAHQGDMTEAAARLATIEFNATDRIFHSAQILTRYHSLGAWVAAANRDADAVQTHLMSLERHTTVVVLDTVRANLERARACLDEPAVVAQLDDLIAHWSR
jgi:serine/threonine protein kinase